tara:strand:+ start:52 stop:273 length:222 start_codon:yes stop_codon:yes gene_type:complete
MSTPSMQNILELNLRKYKNLKIKAKEKFEKEKLDHAKKISSLNKTIKIIESDLKQTKGNDYPASGKFFPNQNW